MAGSRNRNELCANEIGAEIKQLLFTEALARESQLQDRYRGCVVTEDVSGESFRAAGTSTAVWATAAT